MVSDSTARDIALNAPASANASVRPKILRRPAQFSNSAAVMPLNIPPAIVTESALELNPRPIHSTRAWQDDGKFAVTLLTLVILMNLAVIIWLAAIAPKVPAHPTAQPVVASETPVHELGSGDTGTEQ